MARSKRKPVTFYDCKFEDYSGSNRFMVRHPAHQMELRVAAPDMASAIKAAGDHWGETWAAYGFYAYCDVYPG